jgi:hypothetical protein
MIWYRITEYGVLRRCVQYLMEYSSTSSRELMYLTVLVLEWKYVFRGLRYSEYYVSL